MTPAPIRAFIYARNLLKYEDPLGPTVDYLRDKKEKTYREIIDSASRPNTNFEDLLGKFEKWIKEGVIE